MMYSFITSYLLLFITILLYFIIRKKNDSSNIYLFLLIFMSSAIIFFPKIIISSFNSLSFPNIVLFISLLYLFIFPWKIFDNWIIKKQCIILNIPIFKIIFTISIILSIFSIIYCLPFALKGFFLGAAEVRSNSEISLLPKSIVTTIAVSIAGLSPLMILFFFLATSHKLLHKYRLLLFISSFSYVVSSMAFMARDGLVSIILIYIVFYINFRKFILQPKYVKKIVLIIFLISTFLISIYSIDRFGKSRTENTNLILGTYGYFFQQPYVFNSTINEQTNFHGFTLRFPIINSILGIEDKNFERTKYFETMFGTMFSEFYSVSGYNSLFLISGFFLLFFLTSIKFFIRKKRYASIVLLYTVYLHFLLTGLFYFKYGTSISHNLLLIIFMIVPFLLNKNLISFKNYG